MTVAWIANTAWMLTCRPSLRRFHRATESVQATQRSLLQQMLASNQDCEFGCRHHFQSIQHPDQFRDSVPIQRHGELSPWIERIADGEQKVLTAKPVRLLQPTSGSVAGRRLVPYTDSLRHQFRQGIAAWIADLFDNHPSARKGRAYWSVTPAIPSEQPSAGPPVGFDDDTEYLGVTGRLASKAVLAIPPGAMREVTADQIFLETLGRLVALPDLALISVWSPTFLIMLLQMLDEEAVEVIRLSRQWCGHHRQRIVNRILDSDDSVSQKAFRLWPRLALVSSWADASSATFYDQLRKMLPHVGFQPKGLVSTECLVSFPLTQQSANVLSVRSHFYEFLPVNSNSDTTKLAHELDLGTDYNVIVTTGGGLYRYQTDDVVTVVGYHHECPLLRFVGRAGRVSDMVGEKLTDAFVTKSLHNALNQLGVSVAFSCLVATTHPSPGYEARIDPLPERNLDCQAIQIAIEQELSSNPYYKHAVQTGQLRPLAVQLSSPNQESQWQKFQADCLSQNMQLGNIKPFSLVTTTDQRALDLPS